MLLDDGVLELYKIKKSKSETGKPIKTLEKYDEAWFSIINTSISEFYNAKQADIDIDIRVEILENRKVTSKDIVVIDDVQYSVGRVYHGLDEDEIPITDITLEKVDSCYEIK